MHKSIALGDSGVKGGGHTVRVSQAAADLCFLQCSERPISSIFIDCLLAIYYINTFKIVYGKTCIRHI